MDDSTIETPPESLPDPQESEWTDRLEAELQAAETDAKPNYLAIVLSGISGAVYAFVLWLALQAHERKAARELYGQSERQYFCRRTVVTGVAGGAVMLGMLHAYARHPVNSWWIFAGAVVFTIVLIFLRWLWQG